jgi:hypothetical protein
MEITQEQATLMRKLTKEGKPISKVVAEDFPQFAYWDVYFAVYSKGERSSTGIKRMITNRINEIADSNTKKRRAELADELHGLVWHLYSNHKANQSKLAKIRSALD